MPIRPENRARYPANWKEIRAQILERAKHRCERCQVPNGAMIARGQGRHAGTYYDRDGHIRDEETGKVLGFCRECEYEARAWMVRVVLTIAHLDHTPENCDPANLQALCQTCHNRLDAPMRAAGRKARAPQGQLFETKGAPTKPPG